MPAKPHVDAVVRPSVAQGPSVPQGKGVSAYERAFAQWSPSADGAIGSSATPPATDRGVSFHVYTPQDIGAGRGPMRSLPVVAVEEKKWSVAVRVGIALVGVSLVLLTVAAVVAVSTDDPARRPAATATASAEPVVPSAVPIVSAAPTPSTISIGDPVDELPASPIVTAPAKPRSKSTTVPSAQTESPVRAAPKVIIPPPNPYGS